MAVGKLAGQGGDIKRPFATGQLARLTGGLARGGGLDHLADDHPRFRRVFLEPGLQGIVHHAFDRRPHLGGHKLVLGLRGELRIWDLHRQNRRQSLAAIVPGERNLLLAGGTVLLGVAGDLTGQGSPKSSQMSAAVTLRDVVREAIDGLVIAVVPPQGAFHRHTVALRLDHDRGRHQRTFVAVEIFHERLDAALVVHLLALLDRVALVGQHDADAGIEERELTQPMLDGRPVEFDHGEGFGRRQECDLGPALLGVADRGQRRHRLTVAELHRVSPAVSPDRELEPARQGVDHRDTDAVQAAGHLVGILVEFSAGMQLGHDDLSGRYAFALVDVHRDTAAVVSHRARPIRVERNAHFLGKARERLVDRVVDHLVHHVVQARTIVGVADIHAGPLADGIEAFENLDGSGIVVGCQRFLTRGFGHGCSNRYARSGKFRAIGVTRNMGIVQGKKKALNTLKMN